MTNRRPISTMCAIPSEGVARSRPGLAPRSAATARRLGLIAAAGVAAFAVAVPATPASARVLSGGHSYVKRPAYVSRPAAHPVARPASRPAAAPVHGRRSPWLPAPPVPSAPARPPASAPVHTGLVLGADGLFHQRTTRTTQPPVTTTTLRTAPRTPGTRTPKGTGAPLSAVHGSFAGGSGAPGASTAGGLADGVGSPPAWTGQSPLASYTGQGVDACTMQTDVEWSKFLHQHGVGAWGVYLGGLNYTPSCRKQDPRNWVAAARSGRFLHWDLWVGYQSPCITFSGAGVDLPWSTTRAWNLGVGQADEAAVAARRVGDPVGPVFLDFEPYYLGGACGALARAYVGGWCAQLHHDGVLCGQYGDWWDIEADTAKLAGPDQRPDEVIYSDKWLNGNLAGFSDPWMSQTAIGRVVTRGNQYCIRGCWIGGRANVPFDLDYWAGYLSS